MRDMTLLETACFAGLLSLSLVLPLMLSFHAPQSAALRQKGLWIVCIGQALLAAAGIAILASGAATPVASVLGALSCGVCAALLHRQLGANLAR
jgi:hypothetical protein